MKLTNQQSVHNLSQAEFDALTPDQIREMSGSIEQPQDEDDVENTDGLDQEEDETGDESPDEDSQEDEDEDQDEDDQGESDEEDPEDNEDDSELDDEEGEVDSESDPVKVDKVPTKKQKAPEKGKAEPAQETEEGKLSYEELEAFHKSMTATIKASGSEFKFDKPEELVPLIQKGLHFTQKMQTISHLRGINEILKENDLLDPARLAFAVDVMNHKPEAIARLLQDSGIEAYDLDEDKASGYVAAPVNIEAKGRVSDVREIVEANANNPKFNAMFNEARTWDDASQVALVNNPQLLAFLADHAETGVYDQVMHEVKRQRLLGISAHESMLDHYHRVGSTMFPSDTGNGGSAQAPKAQAPEVKNNAPAPKVVVKRSGSDVNRARKLAGGTAASKKTAKGSSVRTTTDVFSLSKEDFDALTPDQLRKLK